MSASLFDSDSHPVPSFCELNSDKLCADNESMPIFNLTGTFVYLLEDSRFNVLHTFSFQREPYDYI